MRQFMQSYNPRKSSKIQQKFHAHSLCPAIDGILQNGTVAMIRFYFILWYQDTDSYDKLKENISKVSGVYPLEKFIICSFRISERNLIRLAHLQDYPSIYLLILYYGYTLIYSYDKDQFIPMISFIQIFSINLFDPMANRSGDNFYNETGQSFNSNPASLKGKLQTLQQQIKNISNELNNHKKEVQILRSEKDTLESVLTMKTADVKKSLSNQLVRIEEEMKRHFNFQKAQNSRIQQQITALKGEKTALQQQLLGLQRRITELEMQVGSEAQ